MTSLALVCLAGDIKDASERISKRLRDWGEERRGKEEGLSAAMPVRITPPAMEDDLGGKITQGEECLKENAPPFVLPPKLAFGPQGDILVRAKLGQTPTSYRPPQALESAYVKAMRAELFEMVEGLNEDSYFAKPNTNKLRSSGGGGGGGGGRVPSRSSTSQRLMKVGTEMSRLQTDTDFVHWSSTILTRVDDTQIDLLRALITGPAGTPYANGVFLFDILLPPDFPDVNPSVQFITTAGGRVRFNPNLYADGKVCLSLLGTWEGPRWVPGVSTLSQVLLSIQSAILVESPWANEPGDEAHLGTDLGIRAIAQHNLHLRLATVLYAILEPLKKPPRFFEEAVLAHFKHKKGEIMAQVALWTEEALLMAAYEEEVQSRYRVSHRQLGKLKSLVEWDKVSKTHSHWSQGLRGHEVFGALLFFSSKIFPLPASHACLITPPHTLPAFPHPHSRLGGRKPGHAATTIGVLAPISLASIQ